MLVRCTTLVVVAATAVCLFQCVNGEIRMKGITFTGDKYCPNVTFDSPKSDLSLKNLASTGADWIALVVTQYQDIYPLYSAVYGTYYTFVTATDDSLRHAIGTAHSLGLSVMLKPHIDLTKDDNQYWRGDIGDGFTESDWALWFRSYSHMLLHYAELAEHTRCEMLSMGCELITTSKRDAEWRALISEVRKVYTGKLTDAANWGYLDSRGGEETNKTWWDAVDYIGVDAYYPILPDNPDPTLAEVIFAWEPVVQRLYNLSVQHDKQVIITEIGYCSPDCSRSSTSPVNLEFQAIHYEGLYATLWLPRNDWFGGVFWWSWNSDPAFGGDKDRCISPQFKPAEDVLRRFYGGTTKPQPPPYPAECICTV